MAIEQRKKRSKKKKGLRAELVLHGMAYGHPGRDSSRHHQHQRPTAAGTRQPVGRCVIWARVFFIEVVAISANLLALVRDDTDIFQNVWVKSY